VAAREEEAREREEDARIARREVYAELSVLDAAIVCRARAEGATVEPRLRGGVAAYVGNAAYGKSAVACRGCDVHTGGRVSGCPYCAILGGAR